MCGDYNWASLSTLPAEYLTQIPHVETYKAVLSGESNVHMAIGMLEKLDEVHCTITLTFRHLTILSE
jgi:hypothetical protein